jgi:hypothetical protein
MPTGRVSVARRRRLAFSVAALAAAVLAALWRFDLLPTLPSPAPSSFDRSRPLIEFDRFSARWEKSETGERLSASLRLRTSHSEGLQSFVFVVTRNDNVEPRRWSIWPPQGPGPAISVGGHFHGATPTTGHSLILVDDWTRITATMEETPTAIFDTVVVYVVDPQGRVLLSRPFRI